MSALIDEILAAEREHSLGLRMLPAADRDWVRERVFARYGRRSHWLWEIADDCASVQNGDAWRWIREFVGARSCVMLFDLDEEVEMFHVPSGSSLDELLANTFGFEFYVTDVGGTYLICFNHHDFLVCCGSARPWLEQRRSHPAVRRF